jgi:drug/metabolite transporter (DMT)-like permease
VFFSFPLFTAIFALAFRLEPFRRRTFLALALGGAGVASIFEVSRSEPAGPLLALGAAVVVAVYFILAGIFLRGIPSAVGATWTATGAGIALLLASLVTKQGMPAEAWWGAVALGVLTAVAFTTLYAAMQRLGSARTAVAQMFEPVVTVVLAAMFLGEQITWRVALGAALIVSSLPILAGTARRKKDVPPAADSL